MRRFWRRLSAFMQRRKLRRELAEEMAAHREMMPEERQVRFGSALRLQEEAADQWGWVWLDQLMQDLKYGIRALRRSPGFALTAIAVLALGIGVNLTEIQMVQAVRHRLNVRDADSIYQLRTVDQRGTGSTFSFPAIDFYRHYSTVFSSSITETEVLNLFHEDDPNGLACSAVSGNFFGDLGITPAYGRMLDEGDDTAGSEPVAVLAWSYWQARFGGDRGLLMQTIRLNGKAVRVIGIAPEQFGGLIRQPVQVWIAAEQYPHLSGDVRLLTDPAMRRTFLLGRLKPGIAREAAEAQFNALAAQLRKHRPGGMGTDETIVVQSANNPPMPPGPVLLVFITFVVLVLLVLLSACANLGNMLLARGLAREREIQIRLAVGASRWRVIRQLMTENFLLAALASVAAFFVGQIAGKILMVYILKLPHIRMVTDWKLVLSCAGLGLIAMLAFGLAPAFQTVRRGRAGLRARKTLVSVQVCASCVLLIVSSFFSRSVQRAYRTDVTFDLPGMALVDPAFYLHRFTAAQAQESARAIEERLRQMPGIDAVAATTQPPFTRGRIEHVSGQQVYVNSVDAAWFPMVQVPVLSGRLFEQSDRDVAVVSETAARRVWPNESPIGKMCVFSQRNRTVIGVVKDSGENLLRHPDSVEAYIPIDAADAVYATIVVHATRNPAQMSGAIRSAATLPGVVPQVLSFRSMLDNQADSIRKTVEIIGSLGLVASGLAMIGIFGLLAFTVAQRTREIGVRMALGARAGDVLRSVLAQYGVPFGIGAGLGVALAVAAEQVMRTIVYGFLPFDPWSVVLGLTLFGAIALAATIVPARRALRVDPASALRYE